jgi:hypothetical protein
MTVEESLSKVEALASRLNEKTDSLNQTIETIEQRLDAANVGVEVWSKYFDQKQYEDGSFRAWELGYGKGPKGWGIVVKRIRGSEGIDHFGNPDIDWRDEDDRPPTALLDAPREVRMNAAGLLEDLLDEIAKQIKSYTEDIEKAAAVAGK